MAMQIDDEQSQSLVHTQAPQQNSAKPSRSHENPLQPFNLNTFAKPAPKAQVNCSSDLYLLRVELNVCVLAYYLGTNKSGPSLCRSSSAKPEDSQWSTTVRACRHAQVRCNVY